MALTRRHLIVKGRVHGVGFRWSCRAQAEEFGVAGWVRNLPNGTVEVVAEGDDDAVQQLVAWCHRGPLAARVSAVQDRNESARGEIGFSIR